MAYDNKSDSKFKTTARASAGATKPGMNPLVAGIIIGLLLGIFLALGVAMWLNRAATPFVEKTRQADTLPPMKSTEPAKTAPSDAAKAAPSDAAKQRFDFYDILPADKARDTAKKADAASTSAATPAPPTKTEVKPAAIPATPAMTPAPATAAKTVNETLYLQAGAFQSESEADAMKAKIAFSGFEANVKPVNVAGKGTLYRVRLGPYKSQDEVNRIKNVLSQNGIGAAVVKPE
jgi:cell division protein FtsN